MSKTREIKFRAWVKCDHCEGWEIVHSVGVYPSDSRHTGPLCVSSDGIFVRADVPEEVILMQFTGLRDKSGKDIYEGDILQDGEGVVGEVVWRRGAWDIGRMSGFTRYTEEHIGYKKPEYNWPPWWVPAVGWKEALKVIGNTYENPELIEAGKP